MRVTLNVVRVDEENREHAVKLLRTSENGSWWEENLKKLTAEIEGKKKRSSERKGHQQTRIKG